MNYILETERLRLREFTLDDAEFIIELMNSPGWLKFIGDRNINNTDQAIAYLENGPIKSYREKGFGLWLVETKDPERPIGMCGILKREHLINPDIGFAFLPVFTGKGFAFEAALATLNFAKQKLNFKTIFGMTVSENDSSIRLLEKIGMRFTHTSCLSGNNEELLIYSSDLADNGIES